MAVLTYRDFQLRFFVCCMTPLTVSRDMESCNGSVGSVGICEKSLSSIATLLHLRGLSEPEFYGDLVYKVRKINGKNDFPYNFKKIIVHYKKIGYNIDVLRQAACLVVNPIKVKSFAYLFNCTTVGRFSD